MKYIKQLLIILFISLLGEICKYFIPLPIPASIYGMAFMFAGLVSGVIKLDSVKQTGKFLIEIMPVMFIPAAVGILESVDTLKAILIPILLITVIPIITVMAATGLISQGIIRKGEKKNHE